MPTSDPFESLFTPKVGRTLIAGSHVYGQKEDRRQRYADVVGVDMQKGPGVDVVADLESAPLGEFAHIECMSMLEHCQRPWLVCANLERMLEPGGTIFITAPFAWRVHGYPDDYFRFTVSGVKSLFTQIAWQHEAYAHRHLTTADQIPWARSADDWPCIARTEVCLFGAKK